MFYKLVITIAIICGISNVAHAFTFKTKDNVIESVHAKKSDDVIDITVSKVEVESLHNLKPLLNRQKRQAPYGRTVVYPQADSCPDFSGSCPQCLTNLNQLQYDICSFPVILKVLVLRDYSIDDSGRVCGKLGVLKTIGVEFQKRRLLQYSSSNSCPCALNKPRRYYILTTFDVLQQDEVDVSKISLSDQVFILPDIPYLEDELQNQVRRCNFGAQPRQSPGSYYKSSQTDQSYVYVPPYPPQQVTYSPPSYVPTPPPYRPTVYYNPPVYKPVQPTTVYYSPPVYKPVQPTTAYYNPPPYKPVQPTRTYYQTSPPPVYTSTPYSDDIETMYYTSAPRQIYIPPLATPGYRPPSTYSTPRPVYTTPSYGPATTLLDIDYVPASNYDTPAPPSTYVIPSRQIYIPPMSLNYATSTQSSYGTAYSPPTYKPAPAYVNKPPAAVVPSNTANCLHSDMSCPVCAPYNKDIVDKAYCAADAAYVIITGMDIYQSTGYGYSQGSCYLVSGKAVYDVTKRKNPSEISLGLNLHIPTACQCSQIQQGLQTVLLLGFYTPNLSAHTQLTKSYSLYFLPPGNIILPSCVQKPPPPTGVPYVATPSSMQSYASIRCPDNTVNSCAMCHDVSDPPNTGYCSADFAIRARIQDTGEYASSVITLPSITVTTIDDYFERKIIMFDFPQM